MFWQPLSVVRLCSFFVSSLQLVFYVMAEEEGAVRWFWHRLSGLQGGSVLTAPRSGQGRGARVASDPERERMDGWQR